jgi:hypothetical protein
MRGRSAGAGNSTFSALLVAVLIFASSLLDADAARAGGACTLVPNDRDPSAKILQCGQQLTVRPARGARFRPIYTKGQEPPSAIRLDDGAILIEYHPQMEKSEFQILTPLAIAAVRGTKWAMEVMKERNSTLVLNGAVAVTSRRLNEYVVLRDGEGVDITPSDTTMIQKRWGEARVRALMARFGE